MRFAFSSLSQRRTARTWVDFNLAQFGLNAVGGTARATLAAIALGAWNPLGEESRLKPGVDYVVARYRTGLP